MVLGPAVHLRPLRATLGKPGKDRPNVMKRHPQTTNPEGGFKRVLSGFEGRRVGAALAASAHFVLLLALGLTLALPVAFARAPGGGTGSEGQGSLPSFNGGTGVALVGSLGDVLATLGQVSGDGEVELYSLDDNVSIALLTGDLVVTLDRAEMAERGVTAHLALGDALASGLAEVGYGAWRSGMFTLPEMSVELPLTSLYGTDIADGQDLTVRAIGHDRSVYAMNVRLNDNVLTLGQSLR